MDKRCFICGAKENEGHCTSSTCPRYIAPVTAEANTTATIASTEKTQAAGTTDEQKTGTEENASA